MRKTIKPSGIGGSLEAPSSKSAFQRAVAAALLSNGTSTIQAKSLCDDSATSLQIAKMLGATIVKNRDGYIIRGGMKPISRELNINESGLSLRMFSAIASLSSEPITIHGNGSILNRPVNMIREGLSQFGVSVETNNDFLPVKINGHLKGGTASIDGSISSQFLTGLLMALPLTKEDTVLHVENLKSKPYIDLTLEILNEFGIEVTHQNHATFNIRGNQQYNPTEINIEGDWSGAAFMLVAAVVSGEINLENLSKSSQQSDIRIIEALQSAGAVIKQGQNNFYVQRRQLRPFFFDATDCPDLFPPLVALAANCNGVSTVKGVHRLSHKESSRDIALTKEYAKLGIQIEITDDSMIIYGGNIHGGTVDSHNDHRIAMSMAIAGLNANSNVMINDAGCVSKSYPDFFNDLEKISLNN